MKKEAKIAEVVGAIIGDGHILRNGKSIEIVGHPIEDKEYLHLIGSFCNELFEIKFKETIRERALRINLNSKSMQNYFVAMGLPRGRKAETVEIPKIYLNSPYLKNVIRGIFDTDGYLFFDKRKAYIKPYPRVGIHIKSKKLGAQLNQMLNRMGFSTYFTITKKNAVVVEIYGHNQLQKWLNTIGFLNKKHLDKCLSG